MHTIHCYRRMNAQKMPLTFFTLLNVFLSAQFASATFEDRGVSSSIGGVQSYIIHVRHPTTSLSFSDDFDSRENWYKSFLPISTASLGKSRLIYSYKGIIDGFAARLTTEELDELKRKTGFVHAYPDRILPLQTTHSRRFMGLEVGSGFWKDSNFGKGSIIGVLDTGISPDHPSFSGKGIPPPPKKWKGACEFNNSLCNNKLIGAKTFVRGADTAMRSGELSAMHGPYDEDGHGTHTASTAAGAFVKNANVDGQAKGTAAGMAPFAHLAIYKVCAAAGCFLSDILAGMDAAVEDGIDILSLSISGDSTAFYNDALAIGAFGAIQKGVFVSIAAGNSGPSYYSVTNAAPWMLTVGAGTTDRSVRTTIKLGNNAELNGESAYQPKGFNITAMSPLVYPGSMGLADTFCGNGSLDSIDVKGKVVLCDDGNVNRMEKGETVKRAGGVAMIIANFDVEGFTIPVVPHVLPASHVSYDDGLKIKSYIDSDPTPKATIAFKGTLFGKTTAPMVAHFSSRGPSLVDPTILKPDIIGPGVNILAAWPVNVGTDPATRFNIASGTSMSTPHLGGIAALLKSVHPDWSPAAIKSAIMTTANINANGGKQILDQNLKPADLLATGAGYVNPVKASNPGLIYDISPDEYIAHLCGLGYSNRQVNAITRNLTVNCRSIRKKLNSDLNYPSFMVTLSQINFYNVTVSRTLTNVGARGSAYTVQIKHPKGVAVRVTPKKIAFANANQKVKFSVTFTGDKGIPNKGSNIPQGYLTWVSPDMTIQVNSPILVIIN